MSWDSSVNRATKLRGGQPGIDFRQTTIFSPAITSTLVQGLTQPPVQWLTRYFPQEKSGRYVKLTIHLNLVPRLRTRGAMPPLSIRLHGNVLT